MISKIIENLEHTAHIVPVPVYWLDVNQVYVGVNEATLKAIGVSSYKKDLCNKTPNDIYPQKMAIEIVAHHQEVIRSNRVLTFQEAIVNLTTKKPQYFHAVISPLRNDKDEIIGTIGISFDITEEKKKIERYKKETIFKQLNMIAPLIPANIYWLDINNIIIGFNEKTLHAIGLNSYEEAVGKSVYDIYPKETADIIAKNHTETMKTRKTLKHEEVIKDVKTGEIKYFITVKTPLFDDDKVIGSLGVSIDITDRKKMEDKLNAAKIAAECANILKTNFIQNMQHDIKLSSPSVWSILDNLVSCLQQFYKP